MGLAYLYTYIDPFSINRPNMYLNTPCMDRMECLIMISYIYMIVRAGVYIRVLYLYALKLKSLDSIPLTDSQAPIRPHRPECLTFSYNAL